VTWPTARPAPRRWRQLYSIPTAIRADDGGDSFAMKLQLSAIAERLESQDCSFLSLSKAHSFARGHFNLLATALAGVRRRTGLDPVYYPGSMVLSQYDAVRGAGQLSRLLTTLTANSGGSRNKTPYIGCLPHTAFSCTDIAAMAHVTGRERKEAGTARANSLYASQRRGSRAGGAARAYGRAKSLRSERSRSGSPTSASAALAQKSPIGP